MSDQMDPLDLLTHELASVSVSPDFAARVRDRIAQSEELGLETLTTELAGVSVSPEFAVRVRQQIESAPARPRWFAFFDWRWAVPVGAAAAIALTMMLWRPGATMPAPVVADVAPPKGVESTIAGVQSEAPTNHVRGGGVQSTAQSQIARATTAEGASIATTGENDKLEVITDQPEMFRRMWAQAGLAVTGEPLPTEVREITVASLEVRSVVVQWLVEPESVSGAAPVIRRISAEAERSAK